MIDKLARDSVNQSLSVAQSCNFFRQSFENCSNAYCLPRTKEILLKTETRKFKEIGDPTKEKRHFGYFTI